MTLLSRDEVDAIRDRARGARACGECEIMADDVDRLLQDLTAAPPLIIIAAEGAGSREMVKVMRAAANDYRGPVYVLPHGWLEATDEQKEKLSRGLRHVAREAREECAKIVEGMRDVFEAPEIAKAIRALSEPKVDGP